MPRSPSAVPRSRRPAQKVEAPTVGEPPNDVDAELVVLVGALYAAETGAPVDVGELPYYTACWFLDHAPQFRRTVAYAAFRLMQQLARGGNDELRARVATALLPFVDLYAEKVEELLLEILERSPTAAGA